MSVLRTLGSSRRWSLISRIVAAIGGGYVLTALITVTASLLLTRAGMARAQAVIAASLGSFAVFAVVVMAVFHARSATRVWIWILGLSGSLALLAWLLRYTGGAP